MYTQVSEGYKLQIIIYNLLKLTEKLKARENFVGIQHIVDAWSREKHQEFMFKKFSDLKSIMINFDLRVVFTFDKINKNKKETKRKKIFFRNVNFKLVKFVYTNRF